MMRLMPSRLARYAPCHAIRRLMLMPSLDVGTEMACLLSPRRFSPLSTLCFFAAIDAFVFAYAFTLIIFRYAIHIDSVAAAPRACHARQRGIRHCHAAAIACYSMRVCCALRYVMLCATLCRYAKMLMLYAAMIP